MFLIRSFHYFSLFGNWFETKVYKIDTVKIATQTPSRHLEGDFGTTRNI